MAAHYESDSRFGDRLLCGSPRRMLQSIIGAHGKFGLILVEELASTQPAPEPTTMARRNPITAQSVAALVPLLLVLLVFVGYFAVYVAYARNLFSFPFDYDQGEGFELYDGVRLARGENIYLDNAQFPFYSSNYPPVYRTMLVPLIWLFGPKLYVGRMLAFACSLLIGVVIFVAARRMWRIETGDWRVASNLESLISNLVPLLAALAFFAANFVYHVGPLARAHLPMVMFAIAGILCLDVGLKRLEIGRAKPPISSLVLSGLGVALLMTAGFTKLQAVDALVAGFGYLLLRRPKWFVLALLICVVVTAAIVLPLNAVTHGQFWLNVVSANVNEYDINITWRTYGAWFQTQGVLIVCSVAYVVWDVVNAIRQRSFAPLTIWSMYFVAGTALGMLTGKWGAGPTYLIAAIAASCVCTAGLLARVGQGLARVQATERDQRLGGGRSVPNLWSQLSIVTAVLFCIQSALNVHMPTNGRIFGPIAQVLGLARRESSYPPYPYVDAVGYTQLGHWVLPEDTENGWALVHQLQTLDGPIWSEEAMLTLWAGKDVVTNPTQLLNLSKSGMLDSSRMIDMINQRKFGAVIFRAMFYPDDVKDAIVKNYYWAAKYKMNGFEYWLLLPGGK